MSIIERIKRFFQQDQIKKLPQVFLKDDYSSKKVLSYMMQNMLQTIWQIWGMLMI